MNDLSLDARYFDNAATTRTLFCASAYNRLGNPNSIHNLGVSQFQTLENARKDIMETLGAKSGNILFGFNATNIYARIHEIFCNKYWCKFVTSNFEHECVDKYGDGIIEPNNVRPDNILSHILVNNITGDNYTSYIKELRMQYPDNLIVVDATAAIGHINLGNITDYCDCLFASAHKFYGPVGVGFAWVSDRFNVYMNDLSLNTGTPPVDSIVAMADAFKYAINFADWEYVWASNILYLIVELKKQGINAEIVSKNTDNPTYAINAIYIEGINAEALVQYLSNRGYYISAAHSACEPNNRILDALKVPKEKQNNIIRISFSKVDSDIIGLVDAITEFWRLFH